MILVTLLQRGVNSEVGNATEIILVPGKSNEAVLSPCSSPAGTTKYLISDQATKGKIMLIILFEESHIHLFFTSQ